MSELIPPTGKYNLGPQEETFFRKTKARVEEYRQEHEDWGLKPRLCGATASGILVIVDRCTIPPNAEGILQPKFVIWTGSLRDKPTDIVPIATPNAEIWRDGGSTTIGGPDYWTRTEADFQAAVARAQKYAAGLFPEGVENFRRFLEWANTYGSLYIPSRDDKDPQPTIGVKGQESYEAILPIDGEEFFIEGSVNP